ncbi:unnamed protein product [Lathyrus sativus]|nr:unnamed protein product [Lathyrus sativus]
MVKLNADGVCKDNNRARCWGIIKDSAGNWVGGFVIPLGWCNTFVAEFWEVFEGPKYTKRLRLNKVEINLNSTVFVKVFRKGGSRCFVGHALMKQIRRLIELHGEIKVVHVYRESNRCVDKLVSVGNFLEVPYISYNVAPHHHRSMLKDDSKGVVTPRMMRV